MDKTSQRPTGGDIKLWWASESPLLGAFLLHKDAVVDNAKKNTALQLHLKTGEVVICDFTGLHEPEMVKRRPVLVISKTSTHWRGLCTIVPLSSSEPTNSLPWHVLLSRNPLSGHLPADHPFQKADRVWAKCDMLYTFAFDRITRPHIRSQGSRTYPPVRLPKEDLSAVFDGVRAYLPAAPVITTVAVSTQTISVSTSDQIPPWD